MATKKTATKKTAAKKAPAKKTAVKKTAAKDRPGEKKKTLAEEWTESYRPFIDACRECFAFLSRKYGFTGPEVSVIPPDCLVKYTREGAFVRIASEYGGEPWAVVKAGEGEPFGLHVIIDVLEPSYSKSKPVAKGSVLTADEMRAFVAYLAKFVEKHAAVILSGDPALLVRFKERENALMAARNAP